MDENEAFHHLVSGLDYPMFIVTATKTGPSLATTSGRSGCLVGFVCQASIDPPRLVVLLSKANHTYRTAGQVEALAVHFLGAANHDLATLFGEETGDEIDKFGRCRWETGPLGTTVLPDTRGWVVGRICERLDAGDHVVHLLDVHSTHLGRPAPPLGFQTVKDMEPGHPA